MKFAATLAFLTLSAVSFGEAPPFYSAYIYTKEFRPPALVQGQPYSATQINVVPKAGFKDPLVMTTRVFRDSDGRTRREAQYPGDPQSVFKVDHIVDRAAGYYYVLDEKRRIAHRRLLDEKYRTRFDDPRPGIRVTFGNTADDDPDTPPPPSPEKPTVAPRRGVGIPEPPTSLGKKTINGLEAEGKRQIISYPLGDAEFDAPFTSILESWTSVELKVTLLRTILREPVGIPNEQRLTDIVRDEPPADLFQIPRGFKVVDEPEGFRVEQVRR